MFYYMAFATFVAYWVKGISGFANSLVFSSILTFRANNVNITPVDNFLNIPANALMTWQNRKSISWKIVLPLCTLMTLGTIPGAFWLKTGNTQAIKVLFGFVVMAIAIEMFLRERQMQVRKSSPVFLTIVGLIAGVCSGMFGIGAVLAAYVTRTTKNMAEFRGNICFVFLVDNLFRLWLYWYSGLIDGQVLQLTVQLVPFMIAGLCAGMLLARFVSEKVVKKIVLLLLFVSGVSLVATNLVF